EDGIRDRNVTGVQTCALPISLKAAVALYFAWSNFVRVHATIKTTPAIASGLTDHVWTFGRIAEGGVKWLGGDTSTSRHQARSNRSEERRVGKERKERRAKKK